MASESVRDQLWLQRFDITTLVRFYSREARIRSKWQNVSQVALLLSSFSAVGTALDLLPDTQAQTVLGITTLIGAFFVVTSYTWNHPLKVASILYASEQCRVVDIEAKTVWASLENKNDQQAMEDFLRLQKSLQDATVQIERNGIGYSDRRNMKAAQEAKKVLEYEPPPAPSRIGETRSSDEAVRDG